MRLLFLPFLIFFIASFSFAQTSDTIKTKSGLIYIPLVQGKGEHPVSGQKVKVNYIKGSFANGTIFDKKAATRIIRFTLGNNEVIQGWDEGFRLMKKGEKGIFIIPAQLAYGDKGVKDPDDENTYRIPPDTDLIFEVELLEFK